MARPRRGSKDLGVPAAGRLFAAFERERLKPQKIWRQALFIFKITQRGVFAFPQIAFCYCLEAGKRHRSTQRVFIVDEGMPPISHKIIYDEYFIIISRTGSVGVGCPLYVCALQVGFIRSVM